MFVCNFSTLPGIDEFVSSKGILSGITACKGAHGKDARGGAMMRAAVADVQYFPDREAVYCRIQSGDAKDADLLGSADAGKSILLYCGTDEIAAVLAALPPEARTKIAS